MRLALYAEFVEGAFVIAPVFAHFDEEAEKDMATEQFFDVAAGGGADLFQARAAFANAYGAMRRALDINQTVDARQVFGFFPAFGDDRRDVRNLVAGRCENLFAHQFGGDSALR